MNKPPFDGLKVTVKTAHAFVGRDAVVYTDVFVDWNDQRFYTRYPYQVSEAQARKDFIDRHKPRCL